MTLDRLDLAKPGIEVERTDEAPDDACRGIGIEAIVERAPAEFDLIALRDAEPGFAATGRVGSLLGRGLGEVVGQEGEGGHGSLAV